MNRVSYELFGFNIRNHPLNDSYLAINNKYPTHDIMDDWNGEGQFGIVAEIDVGMIDLVYSSVV